MARIQNITAEALGLEADRPLSSLSVGELAQLISLTLRNCLADGVDAADAAVSGSRKVIGIQGIMDLLHCSRPTAVKYKKTILKDAVVQHGRYIETDADKAVILYRRYKFGTRDRS